MLPRQSLAIYFRYQFTPSAPSAPQRVSTLVSSQLFDVDQIYNKKVSIFITLNMYAKEIMNLMKLVRDQKYKFFLYKFGQI
jgi:hypothetical protein